jgi:acetyltransferase-like isoleucine patch superfamily enzyme
MSIRSSLNKICDLLSRHLPSNALRIGCQRFRGVKIGQNVFLGYDVVIDQTYPELVEIEDYARIGPGVIILAHSRPGDCWMDYMGEKQAPVRVKRHAAIYAGAIITPGVTVGECAIVREGAVVEENVPPFTMVGGIPARVLKELPRDKVQQTDRKER